MVVKILVFLSACFWTFVIAPEFGLAAMAVSLVLHVLAYQGYEHDKRIEKIENELTWQVVKLENELNELAAERDALKRLS
jgi:hypothetical protein